MGNHHSNKLCSLHSFCDRHELQNGRAGSEYLHQGPEGFGPFPDPNG